MFEPKSSVSEHATRSKERCLTFRPVLVKLSLFILCSSLVVGCREEDGDGETTPDETQEEQQQEEESLDPSQDWCPSNSYAADIEGVPGTAQLAYEVGLNVIYVGGEITSAAAYYTFTGCELYRDAYTGAVTNSLCWVDVVDHNYGERFRAELQFYDLNGVRGFILTANAYEGVYSTSYDFVCQ